MDLDDTDLSGGEIVEVVPPFNWHLGNEPRLGPASALSGGTKCKDCKRGPKSGEWGFLNSIQPLNALRFPW
jgi:hypothetical protein